MKYEVETLGTTSVITLKTTSINSTIAPDLKSQFVLISNTDNENLIVDLSEVEMADSSGLGALLLAFRIYRDSDRKMVLTNVHPNVAKLLEITQLNTVFEQFPDRESAVQALATD